MPEAFASRHTVAHLTETFGDEVVVVAAFAALALLGHGACVEQDAEVLGGGGAAHLEVRGDISDQSFILGATA